jgi:hypothetical protein
MCGIGIFFFQKPQINKNDNTMIKGAVEKDMDQHKSQILITEI